MKRNRQHSKRPQRNASTDAQNPLVFWLHGLAMIGDERWEEAIVAFQQFLDVSADARNRTMAHFNLSACYAGLERYDEALSMLAEVEQSTPDDPELWHSRGIVYACAGRIQEAIAEFETFRRRWPREARAYKTHDAIQKLRQIARGKLLPGDYLVEHLEEQIKHNVELGDFHLVERKARRMIEANPARAEGHFTLGVACLEQDRYAEALKAFLAAQERDPDHIPTLYNIGHTYLKMDAPEQAIPWLKRAHAGDPKHFSAVYQLGVACEQLGRRDEALAWWQRTLQLNPDHYLAQQRLHEIGMGPAPVEPPLPPKFQEMKRVTPLVKARMKRPNVYRNGGVTLTYDRIGFVLEDAENPGNASIYAGAPFNVADITKEDEGHILDIIGMIKMSLLSLNAENTRHVAILAYYQDRPVFNYQLQFDKGKLSNFDAAGQFVITEVPRFFKLSIDSDFSTPYGDPMQGILIYLNQARQPGILLNTLTPQGAIER